MDEPKNTSNNEVDLSDSWTIVNSDDSEVNANVETGETSDSESLEVLEVEQETSEQNSQDDLESSLPKQNVNVCSEEEENYSEECSEDCHNSFLIEDPLIHLAEIQKVRNYVHHPSAYINMWLSVVMVIAIAVTLGLGIGHYLGSKRFARAKDMIHHLKYENQILEQELADVTMKNKHCESDLLRRVRQLVVKLNESELPGSYCRSNHFQDMYANLMHGRDEDVCYAEENPLFANFRNHNFVNDTLPQFVHWISCISDGEQVMDYPFEDEFTINRSYIITKNSDNALSDVELLPKLEVIKNQMHSNTSHFQFSKLNTHLTYLHSLLKKWNKFHGNLKLPASDSKTEGLAGLRDTEHLSDVAHKVVHAVSGSPYKVLNENVRCRIPNSSNDFCRLNQINQCVLHEKSQKKEKKCYALTKAQLLCSLLQRSKKKQGNKIMLGKQKVYAKKDKKSEVQQFSFEQKKYRKVEKAKYTNEKKNGKGENGKLGTKVLNYSESVSKRMKKKDKAENWKKADSKEKKNKFRYIKKDQNIDQKQKKHDQSEIHYNHLHGQKKQLSKPITKYIKQLNNYERNENIKSKGKQHINWGKNKMKYKGKFSNSEKMNRKIADNLISYSNDQRQRKFHKSYKKLTENGKRVAYSRFGSSKKSFHKYEKLPSTKNSNRNPITDLKKCSSVEGHCKFYSKDKRISDKKHYKFAFSGKSYKFKTQSIEKKNDSENSSCKYSFLTHKKDENFPKYLKERGKIYDLNMQEMKVFKT
ncbi:Uncharacterized protein GBIM_02587 [Gryllus bimaculatus]|nr:Uncharacterized protein GBIM_02587 [Gryllus bimaculatus]